MKPALFALLALCLTACATARRDLAAVPNPKAPTNATKPKPPINPCLRKKDNTILPAGNCSNAFYQCLRGKPVTPNPKCATGLVFNPKASPPGCSYVGAVGTTSCNCAAAYKGDAATACTVCQNKGRAGLYALKPFPYKAYVECSTQGAFVMPCNTGLKWNDAKKNCL